jgi:hypothetical protein
VEKKKKPDGIGWQCPLHHICFHFDSNILFSFEMYFKKINFFFILN